MKKLGDFRKFHQIVTIVLLFVFSPFSAKATEGDFPISTLEVNGQRFSIELATTPQQLEQGLMHRKTLAADHGMLFVFSSPTQAAMWMKNTYIPLDMVFINSHGKIVHVAKNATPESLEVIRSPVPVKAVLELAGGTCKKRNIHTGDIVSHAIFSSQSLP